MRHSSRRADGRGDEGWDAGEIAKDETGRRNITLPPEAVAILRAHKVKVLELWLVLGMGNIASETWVFSALRATHVALTT